MANIAEAVGKSSEALEFNQSAQRLKDSANAYLFVPEKGFYKDGTGTNRISAHGNYYALGHGLVPKSNQASVAALLKPRKLTMCNVYGAQFALEGFYNADEGDHALSLLTSTDFNSWAHMIYNVGTTITLEVWDPSQKSNLDWNHAWGTAPSNMIARNVMGITPIEPGYRRFQIRPQPGFLRPM